jgi:hypothetical protein
MATQQWFTATPEELRDLAAAIAHNCECSYDGTHVVRCASHTMALGETVADRRAIEGLIYVRRTLLPLLVTQEFHA